MFDIGASELLMIVIVAVVVIGPKDMPRALRTAGRWIGKMRKVSNHFRSGIDAMVREAELEELERKWREQNEAILKAHPQLPSLSDVEEEAGRPASFGQIPHEEPAMEPLTQAGPLPADSLAPAPNEPGPESGAVRDFDTGMEDQADRTSSTALPPP